MKVLFIGSRLYDDVAYHVDKLGVESIITESNEEAPNLDLPTKYYIVPRGMDKPMEIAIEEEVDAIVPLLGIDPPLMSVAIMKEEIEKKLKGLEALKINPQETEENQFVLALAERLYASERRKSSLAEGFHVPKDPACKLTFPANGPS